MNLFRSEEHVRRWADFDPESADGIKPVRELVRAFSGPLFTQRLSAEYLKRVQEWLPGLVADLDRLDASGADAWRFCNGQALEGVPGATAEVAVYEPGGRFVGVGARQPDGRIAPLRLIATAPSQVP